MYVYIIDHHSIFKKEALPFAISRMSQGDTCHTQRDGRGMLLLTRGIEARQVQRGRAWTGSYQGCRRGRGGVDKRAPSKSSIG